MELKPGYKNTEIGVIPEDWDVRSGYEITDLIGKGASPNWQGFAYSSYGMLFVTSENVRDGFLDVKQPKYLPLAFHHKIRRTKLEIFDVLINIVGASIGRSCQVKNDLGEANINQAVALFRVNKSCYPGYIGYYFQSLVAKSLLLSFQVDAARPNVSLTNLRNMPVILPSKIDEQEKIARTLSDIDSLITSIEKLIEKKKLIKQGAMQVLLTGKKRLPGFSREWETKRLGDVSVVIMGQSPDSKYCNTDSKGIPLIQGNADIQNGKSVFRIWTKSITKECQKGAILITVRAPVGSIGISSSRACLGRGVCAIQPHSINDRYLFWQLKFSENK